MNTNLEKPYYVTKPDGSEVFVLGLNKFCKENKIHMGNLLQTEWGFRRKHANGYKVRKASWADM